MNGGNNRQLGECAMILPFLQQHLYRQTQIFPMGYYSMPSSVQVQTAALYQLLNGDTFKRIHPLQIHFIQLLINILVDFFQLVPLVFFFRNVVTSRWKYSYLNIRR